MGRPSICISAVQAGRSATITSPCSPSTPLNTNALQSSPLADCSPTPVSSYPPALSLRLLVVRHAETKISAIRPRVLCGQNDEPLSSVGIKQAHALAHRLSGEPIECIYTSDLKRAKATAEIIAKNINSKPNVDTRLREQNVSDLAGRSWAEVKRYLKKCDVSYEDYLAQSSPPAETTNNLGKRIEQMYVDVVERHLLTPHGISLGRGGNNKLPPLPEQQKVTTTKTTKEKSKKSDMSATDDVRKNAGRHHCVLLVTHGGPISRLIRHLTRDLGFTAPEVLLSRFPRLSSLYEIQLDYRMGRWTGTLARFNCVAHLAGLSTYVYDEVKDKLIKDPEIRKKKIQEDLALKQAIAQNQSSLSTTGNGRSAISSMFPRFSSTGAGTGSGTKGKPSSTDAQGGSQPSASGISKVKKSLGW